MKGLLLKDLYSVRFQIITGFLIMMFPNIMMWLEGGGMFNDDSMGNNIELGLFTYGMVNYISITLCSSFLLNTLSDDLKSGWAKMQLAMPVTGGKIIGGKLLANGVIIAALMVLSVLCNLIGTAIFGLPVEPMITMPIVLALLQMAVLSTSTALGYKLGVGKMTAVYIVTLIVVTSGLVVLLYAFFGDAVTLAALRWIAYAGVPVLSAVVTLLCFSKGKKAVVEYVI